MAEIKIRVWVLWESMPSIPRPDPTQGGIDSLPRTPFCKSYQYIPLFCGLPSTSIFITLVPTYSTPYSSSFHVLITLSLSLSLMLPLSPRGLLLILSAIRLCYSTAIELVSLLLPASTPDVFHWCPSSPPLRHCRATTFHNTHIYKHCLCVCVVKTRTMQTYSDLYLTMWTTLMKRLSVASGYSNWFW